ncbi:MAG: S26 family signal peptidase [Hyphomicrobiaceae bacterium]|nr:S26 family signal peptidase [Hyphomicrobiaceae bacterium]
MKLKWIIVSTIGVTAIGLSGKAATPLVIWNASPSVPTGLYVVLPGMPRRGELAVVRLAPADREQAHRRGYLHRAAYLLKPVVAMKGDSVCRIRTAVLVNNCTLAEARLIDAAGRPMPAWSGCHTLQPGELFLISSAAASFDSRYLGVIGARQVVGTAWHVSLNTACWSRSETSRQPRRRPTTMPDWSS